MYFTVSLHQYFISDIKELMFKQMEVWFFSGTQIKKIVKRWQKNEEFVKGECTAVKPPGTCYTIRGLWIREVAGTDAVYERGLHSLW